MVHLKTKDVQYGFFLGLTHAMNNFEMGIYDDPTLSETDIMLKLWVHVLDIQFDFDPFFKCHRYQSSLKWNKIFWHFVYILEVKSLKVQRQKKTWTNGR